MGYQITDHEPYIITGKNGKEYQIPQLKGLGVDDFAQLIKYNETDDVIEKIKICKEFFLKIAPDLEEEEIGDVEYFQIFQDYNRAKTHTQKKRVGES